MDEKIPINEIRLWDLQNRENLKYLNQEDVRCLVDILKDVENHDEASIKELKELHARLQRELDDRFHREFDDIKRGMGRLRARLREIPGYPNEPDPVMDHIYHVFDEWYARLEDTKLLDSLQNTYHLFKFHVYPELENRLYSLVNPSVLPLNLVEVIDAMPKLSFSSAEELDELLGQIRREATMRLNGERKQN